MVYGSGGHHRPRITPEQVSADIAKGLEDAAEALRWCKAHLQDRRAADAMRLVELNISYIAQAIDWQMEGETQKAEEAVDRIWWQPHKPEADADFRQPK
ncbi:MAG TPA: hypothetical protein VJB57_00365 [Dehalococcoidia bacterium]|nr:hypothetical protein [Dehalococcoidia bacterium]